MTIDTTTAEQTLEHSLTQPVSPQTHRLLRSGLVNDQTKFSELENILAEDFRNQATVKAIKEWFDSVCPACALEGSDNVLAVALMGLWIELDSDSFFAQFE